MSLLVCPRCPQEGRSEPVGPYSGPDRHPACPAKTNPDRILVGILAGAALFYLLGKAIGLGRNPTES